MTPKKTLSDLFLVAEYFLDKKEYVTNKKLQKLVYYSQAWSLVLFEKPLFKEDIEAWVHGPAVRRLYLKYKEFAWHPIKIEEVKNSKGFSKEVSDLLDQVWDVYGKFDADYLERLTHREDPWKKARKGLDLGENCENTISHKDMKEYYSGLLKR